jgi:hypothetical protein
MNSARTSTHNEELLLGPKQPFVLPESPSARDFVPISEVVLRCVLFDYRCTLLLRFSQERVGLIYAQTASLLVSILAVEETPRLHTMDELLVAQLLDQEVALVGDILIYFHGFYRPLVEQADYFSLVVRLCAEALRTDGLSISLVKREAAILEQQRLYLYTTFELMQESGVYGKDLVFGRDVPSVVEFWALWVLRSFCLKAAYLSDATAVARLVSDAAEPIEYNPAFAKDVRALSRTDWGKALPRGPLNVSL